MLYVLITKKLHISANSGNHQFFSLETTKIVLYIIRVTVSRELCIEQS